MTVPGPRRSMIGILIAGIGVRLLVLGGKATRVSSPNGGQHHFDPALNPNVDVLAFFGLRLRAAF